MVLWGRPKEKNVLVFSDLPDVTDKILEFSVNIFFKCLEKNKKSHKNIVFSPFSALCVLGMAVNGANGNTRKEIEKNVNISASVLNQYMHKYMEELQAKKCKLKNANMIWLNADAQLLVKKEFIRLCKEGYHANIVKKSFNESAELINVWVNKQTDGMIERILDSCNETDIMYLINALAFKDKWKYPFRMGEQEEEFTTLEGKIQKVKMMRSEEHIYLRDKHAEGFLKQYTDTRYCFVALLPDKGVNVMDYIAHLSGKKIKEILLKAQDTTVYIKMPAFSMEIETEMEGILKSMGIKEAFSEKADFTKLGEIQNKDFLKSNIFINKIKQKTYISVDEEGTEASAVTLMMPVCAVGGIMPMKIPKTLILNRPFVYMILDQEMMIPIFMGVLTNVIKSD